ncbi:hypothetical protein GW17_00054679 [Ensete ventricosum]|nr:hypothetical protein GW17_00054679 [Ensete ventricosum]
MSPCLLSRHYWSWPVYVSTSAIVSNGVKMENKWMEGALGSNWIGRLRICWNSGREEMSQLGSAVDSYKKVGSGHSYLRSLLPLWLTMSLYSFHIVHGPYSEARAWSTVAVACRPSPRSPSLALRC